MGTVKTFVLLFEAFKRSYIRLKVVVKQDNLTKCVNV